TPTPAGSEIVEAPELENLDKGKENAAIISPEVEDSPLSNEIPIQPTAASVLEQVVELSILLTGEVFSDDLRDPASLKSQTLSRDLAEKIEDALEGLPGFKGVSVIDFRPQKDTQCHRCLYVHNLDFRSPGTLSISDQPGNKQLKKLHIGVGLHLGNIRAALTQTSPEEEEFSSKKQLAYRTKDTGLQLTLPFASALHLDHAATLLLLRSPQPQKPPVSGIWNILEISFSTQMLRSYVFL
ncbi:hypothetical protein ILYODFUR_033360, partial [Ilyodon furcidens]